MLNINRKLGLLLSAVILTLSSQIAFSYEYKIGIYDLEQLAQKCPQNAELKKEFEKKFLKRAERLRDKEKSYTTKADQFNRDKDILSQSELVKSERELVRLKQELQLQGREYQDDVMRYDQEVQQMIGQAISLAKNDVAKEQHLDLLLPKSPMIYASTDLDVTAHVLKKMNAKYQAQKTDDKK